MSEASRTDKERIRRLVEAAVELMHPGYDEAAVLAALQERANASTREAAEAVIFLPFAFARVLFGSTGIRFSETYLLKTGDQYVEQKFAENEVFQEATRLAALVKQHGPREQMAAIASQSAEFNVINKALNAGVKLHDIEELEPPAVWGWNE